MRVNVTLVFVILVLGLADAARRRVRSTTAEAPKTTPASFVGRQLSFAEQPEELETLWDNFDIQRLDSRSEIWKNRNNASENNHDENIFSSGRQYPGLPSNPGDTNELPSPISPPPSKPPPPRPPPGCLGQRGQYESPASCANYLNCWDDVVIEQTCPAGLLFNAITGYCDFASNVNCGNRAPPTPKPALATGSKQCPDPNGRYRSSTNCSEFYICVGGKPIKFGCPRGLVYSDLLNVCDYTYNVDCKGAATPNPPPKQPSTESPESPSQPSPTLQPANPSQLPTRPPQPPTRPPQPPTRPPQPPTRPSQPPTRPPQPPTRPPQPPSSPPTPVTNPPQPPSYPTQPPSYPTQPPSYPTQPPVYPAQPTYPPAPPSYQPQPYPPPPAYSGNPWLSRIDPWHQRSSTSQLEIEKEKSKQQLLIDSELLSDQPAAHETETSSVVNPWTLFQVIPPELLNAQCNNGDIHRLNDACTNVVVCRNNRPQMVNCSPGFSYDKPSDSCKAFSVAKC
ncbi:uncharacterized protein [Linepithema humile]|uniref:uncharacterized protein n=1 Tax=Linepithema humile TaxID=83485 RepID=UPI00351E951C